MDPLGADVEDIDHVVAGVVGDRDDLGAAFDRAGGQAGVAAHQRRAAVGRQDQRYDVVDRDDRRDGSIEGRSEVRRVKQLCTEPAAGAAQGQRRHQQHERRAVDYRCDPGVAAVKWMDQDRAFAAGVGLFAVLRDVQPDSLGAGCGPQRASC